MLHRNFFRSTGKLTLFLSAIAVSCVICSCNNDKTTTITPMDSSNVVMPTPAVPDTSMVNQNALAHDSTGDTIIGHKTEQTPPPGRH